MNLTSRLLLWLISQHPMVLMALVLIVGWTFVGLAGVYGYRQSLRGDAERKALR